MYKELSNSCAYRMSLLTEDTFLRFVAIVLKHKHLNINTIVQFSGTSPIMLAVLFKTVNTFLIV